VPRRRRPRRPYRQPAALLICLAWLLVLALAVTKLRQADGILVASFGFLAVVLTFLVLSWAERALWRAPIRKLTQFARRARSGDSAPLPGELPAELTLLAHELAALVRGLGHHAGVARSAAVPPSSSVAGPRTADLAVALTRSGLFAEPPPNPAGPSNPLMSGDYATTDMVNRLDLAAWRWIESSPAEQEFLGWSLDQLRQMSFLDIVHPDDRHEAEESFRQALARGEALGRVVRVRTARGQSRAIELNIGARYGTNQQPTHLRCHLADVTEKVRADRQLRLRTRELTQVNDQLRRINHELQELKDRYTDLYENAPAMYFSLDPRGVVIECNQTMRTILNKSSTELIGHPYHDLLAEPPGGDAPARFLDSLRQGPVEAETRWRKATGEVIEVWVRGTMVAGPRGSVSQARCVAQDVTARRRLEAELQEKNQHLAQANEELSRKNRELDEFVHVVSHDLQEPLRTLTAFSDFLLRDYGDRLDPEGQEFVRYLVEASRRMRAMIHGLLNLSRAGKVIGDFREVNLNDLVAVIKTDLGELIRSKNAEVRVRGRLPAVWGDPDRLGQLLANLITNGLKYNGSPNPCVEIGTSAAAGPDSADLDRDVEPGEDATITVTDNGIGIEPQFHRTIFQLFRRLHTQEEYEGTGAGLAIAAKIVQAHGGRIWVESQPGQGATFFIRLRRPLVPGSSPASARPLGGSEPQSTASHGERG